jgi:DNA mismatch repair protein MutL
MTIRVLSDDVASQIAAGEVVERPASVVKELLENAIDAGAKRISIRIEQAGQRLIEISDDGVGISPTELELAVARHATSKLSRADDLFHIRTLGFRGEALASIASVSHFTLTSRTESYPQGGRVTIDGGKTTAVEHIGVPIGTVVKVEDLFYNTPARLKFLKREQTERQQIDALVTRYALAYPNCAFHLVQEDKTMLHTSGNGERREVLSQLYGVELGKQLLEVDFTEDGVTIHGFISPISQTRSNRKEITFFVNGRWVQDSTLTTALLRAYQTFLMVGRYPIAILFIQLEPEDVDVNVHPAKAEVRFRNPDQMFSLTQRAIRRALLAFSPVPQVSINTWRLDSMTAQKPLEWTHAAFEEEQADESPLLTAPNSEGNSHLQLTSQAETPTQSMVFPSGSIPLLRWVGQVGATYLVAEGPDGLYLIDQHAAHERILFEKFMQQKNTFNSQALLEPIVFQLPPATEQLMEEALPILGKFGFSVEEFGNHAFRIRSIPDLFTGRDPVAAVRVVVEDFEEDETPLANELEERLAARICKRMAVKGGQVLSVEEQKKLIQDLETCTSPRTCPHGRPTMIHLSVDLLERQFGRRGARSM